MQGPRLGPVWPRLGPVWDPSGPRLGPVWVPSDFFWKIVHVLVVQWVLQRNKPSMQ